MRNGAIEILAELGRRLEGFGTEAASRRIIREASRANPWFLPGEIQYAAQAVASKMLSAETIEKWLGLYPRLPSAQPKEALVIMAGNIPFVGIQDLVCVLASGHRALVKFSSRDHVLMSYVVSELRDIDPRLPVFTYSDSDRPDAVIAMGGDNAVRFFEERYSAVPCLLRGSRSSAAVLDGTETEKELAALADDVRLYSGLGCRNVSLVFLPCGYDTETLKAAFSAWDRKRNPKFIQNYRQTKAILDMRGDAYLDCGTMLLCEERAFPSAVSRVNYSYYSTETEVSDWICRHESEIQCIASNIPFMRHVPLGSTQRPSPWDYPDGKDTMEFLSGI